MKTPLHASNAGSIRQILNSHPHPRPGSLSQRIPKHAHRPVHSRSHQFQCQRRAASTASNLLNRATPHLPRILQPSLWSTVIPPAFRTKARDLLPSKSRKQPINPATYFIWIYILIGSQAIRILGVKNDHATYSRKAELQIEKLREVVRRLQAGEEVDVEKALGTDVPEEEQAWEDALREIEREERIWREGKEKKKEERERRRREMQEEETQRQDASPVNIGTGAEVVKVVDSATSAAGGPPFKSPGFY